jgi:thiamine biosynthesis lipoprotein
MRLPAQQFGDLLQHRFAVSKFNVPFVVSIVAPADKNVVAVMNELEELTSAFLEWGNEQFSPFLPNSVLSQFRRQEVQLAETESEFQQVYALSMTAEKLTGGAFSPWREGLFDPTGLSKGWLVSEIFLRFVQPLLSDTEVIAVGVDGGGDMQLATQEGTEWYWQIGIRDSFDRDKVMASLRLQNGAIATSGISERGNHIWSECALAANMVTVEHERIIMADILATALMATLKERWPALLRMTTGGMAVTPDGASFNWDASGKEIDHVKIT